MAPKIDLPRVSKGKRPHFFDDPSVDHLLTMVLELSTELSVVYSRLDTLERVLETEGSIDRSKLDQYIPDAAVEQIRNEWRDAFLQRLFRTIGQEKSPASQ